jgi:PAS domain S-box-containing protein
MTPERWQKVEKLCNAALECEGSQRVAFLAQACQGDDELRREVESLLAREKTAEGFLQSPALEIAAAALAKMPAGGGGPSLVGRDMGCYQILSLLGAGGMGRIWLARDSELGRDIALKELRPEKAGVDVLQTRFVREARITAQLEHPGIVPVYELGRRPDDQQPFYTMRFVKGRTLTEAAQDYHRRRIAGEADSLEFVSLMSAFVTVCNTVAYAHSRGIIHRDLKGQNVLLGDFGQVVVLDWGLAKLLDRSEDDLDSSSIVLDREAAEGRDLTLQGQMIGTPAYMAPEQAAGDFIDQRTDVYGLGAILYEIITGQPPFKGSDASDVLRKVLNEDPVPPSQLCKEVPAALEAACLRALKKDRVNRYAGAADLTYEIQTWQEVERRRAEEELDRFFNLSLDLLCIAGFDGHFKRLNPSWERVLGYTSQELCARPFLDFIHPDDRAATAQELAKLVTGAKTIFFENRYACKDGSYRWFLWTAIPSVKEQLVYGNAHDITHRKRTEEVVRGSEQRYRSVISAMQEGIILLDADGAIRACNASAERIVGLSGDQMIGRTAVDPRWRAIQEDGSPFPDETRPAVKTLRTGKPCSNVVMGVHKPDGELTWISINSQPLFGDDGKTPAGVVASFSDITERKHTEERLRQTIAELEGLKKERRGLLNHDRAELS